MVTSPSGATIVPSGGWFAAGAPARGGGRPPRGGGAGGPAGAGGGGARRGRAGGGRRRQRRLVQAVVGDVVDHRREDEHRRARRVGDEEVRLVALGDRHAGDDLVIEQQVVSVWWERPRRRRAHWRAVGLRDPERHLDRHRVGVEVAQVGAEVGEVGLRTVGTEQQRTREGAAVERQRLGELAEGAEPGRALVVVGIADREERRQRHKADGPAVGGAEQNAGGVIEHRLATLRHRNLGRHGGAGKAGGVLRVPLRPHRRVLVGKAHDANVGLEQAGPRSLVARRHREVERGLGSAELTAHRTPGEIGVVDVDVKRRRVGEDLADERRRGDDRASDHAAAGTGVDGEPDHHRAVLAGAPAVDVGRGRCRDLRHGHPVIHRVAVEHEPRETAAVRVAGGAHRPRSVERGRRRCGCGAAAEQLAPDRPARKRGVVDVDVVRARTGRDRRRDRRVDGHAARRHPRLRHRVRESRGEGDEDGAVLRRPSGVDVRRRRRSDALGPEVIADSRPFHGDESHTAAVRIARVDDLAAAVELHPESLRAGRRRGHTDDRHRQPSLPHTRLQVAVALRLPNETRSPLTQRTDVVTGPRDGYSSPRVTGITSAPGQSHGGRLAAAGDAVRRSGRAPGAAVLR